ncbi:hypothetical protein POTOM_060170 [Populus tomentosa]|uniref:WW domain-containing protein n=1 Tax=Populus tomentosa TaxID=118781 RepID=A0A8X7Y0H8_POPTO|nr:hypothetical protein POTOM_060170 [Populus tomentosa]
MASMWIKTTEDKRLAISLDSDLASCYQSVSHNDGGYTAPLPPGWEKRSDAATGKTYYIDHSTRATTWNHPCPDKPWKRSAILSLSQLANLFLLAGDIHATLYTGSKALHNNEIVAIDDGNELQIRQADLYLSEGEELSFYEVLLRARQRREIVIGYRAANAEKAVINPPAKSERRRWSLKDVFVVIAEKE